MSSITRFAAVLIFAAIPVAAQDFPGAAEAQDQARRDIQAFRGRQKEATRPQRAAPPSGPYAKHLGCYRSMGGSMVGSFARVSGYFGNVAGDFVFDASTMEFKAKDPGAAKRVPKGGREEAFAAALTSTARAVLSVDPGAYGMSPCPELEPRRPPTDY